MGRLVIWKVMRNIGGIWETETALIFEVMETQDEMKISYRRRAANATCSIFLYKLQCLFTSEVNQCSLLADGNGNYDRKRHSTNRKCLAGPGS
jgi:hypothetical protein